VIPGIFGVAWLIWTAWSVAVYGSHANLTTLRSDISNVRFPAGYKRLSETVSPPESGNCFTENCTLKEWWVWRGTSLHTASDECRDIARAMERGLPEVESSKPVPRGSKCEYFTVRGSFFRPDLAKWIVEAIVWVNDNSIKSPGNYKIELLAAYGYSGS